MKSKNEAKPPVDGRWAALLLAAGLSRRMGQQNKLLLPIGGIPLIRWMAETYLAAGTDLHIVLGHEAELIEAALGDLPVTRVENLHFVDGGQISSVRAGLTSLSGKTGQYDGILIALADQAALTADDIRGLCQAFTDQGGKNALIPFWSGQRGNPVIFSPEIIVEILAEDPGTGPRQFLDKKPHLAVRYQAPNDHFILDIDTPQDFQLFQSRKE